MKSFIKHALMTTLCAGLVAGSAFAGPNTGPVAKSPVGTFLGSATLWAVINADGTMARSDGGISSKKTDCVTGCYEVIFARNVRGCAYIGTVGGSGSVGTVPTGTINVIGRVSNVNGVFVDTHSLTGAFADRSFHLFVNC